jgi:hypothetical protein
MTKACPAESPFWRLALPFFRATRPARFSHASAMRRRRVLSAWAARFARSRHAAANRRYSNSELIFGCNPLRDEALWQGLEKARFEFVETSKHMRGSTPGASFDLGVREKFSLSLSYLQTLLPGL